jgi:hypothetical protein
MRVESMVAQQAVLAATARRASGTPLDARPAAASSPAASYAAGAGSSLPAAVADRLALFFSADPGFAEAVSAQLPAARQASARDLAAYGRSGQPGHDPHLIDISG